MNDECTCKKRKITDAERIEHLERRVKELEMAPKSYLPAYIPLPYFQSTTIDPTYNPYKYYVLVGS